VTRRALDDARREAAAVEREAGECKREVAATSQRLQQSIDVTRACREERDHICSATAAFVNELSRGRAGGARETGCVAPEQQERLDALVGGWSSAATWMGQLAAYQSGESDSIPRPRPGATAIERSLVRFAREGGGRRYHRRLLVEALRIVAPHAWERLRSAGAAAVETWFTASTPLDTEVVAEARRAPTHALGPAGPPLTSALHLVHAFQVAAVCSGPSADVRECARAKQLRELLESSGSLIVRRRIQEIWATDCTSSSAAAVAAWIEDFPTAHVASAADPWSEIAGNAYAKLFACYLDDPSEHAPYGVWLAEKLPSVAKVNAARLQRIDAIRNQWNDASAEATCARAVRAMQNMAVPAACSVPSKEFRDALVAWTAVAPKLDDAGVPLIVCTQFARLLWEGKAASIDQSFADPPSIDDMVVAKPMPPTPMWRLRAHCEERRGAPEAFAKEIATLASFARDGFGEGIDKTPFRLEPQTSKPMELVRFEGLQGINPWISHLGGATACGLLGLGKERCRVCSEVAPDAAYDCALVARLSSSWAARTTRLLGSLALLVAVVAGTTWIRRLRGARRAFLAWSRDSARFFDGIGLACRADPWRLLLPSRHDALTLKLPSDPAWEQWGSRAALVRAPSKPHVLERDVNHAAFVARRAGANVALLEHDDEASLDLSAVRAMLEWAAKGGSRAVQILPIGISRSRWSKSAHDVLDLVEESSLRGNPFDFRGRIATSTQFFNRERIVSGLLAAAQAGHWMVVTGLRRFGKSSLVLEVARRLPGPSAYVDVAGFDYEIAHRDDPAIAVNAILRFVCLSLVESARTRWPAATMPALRDAGTSMDAAALTQWFRELSRACRDASGRSPPILVVLDELEQALAVGSDRIERALDVMAIVIGRLKSAVGDAALLDSGSPIGVFLTSAVHPLLWAPLRTLAHQSIMGTFQRVCVPSLNEDAATTMMRSLGARQGIRFSDGALARMVAESQGVPPLLRRLGASVLELYDAERARQGSLGAVEIGVEGTAEAIDREAREGSPLRVWIESEIAPPTTATGLLLHCLALETSVPVSTLSSLAKESIAKDFVRMGIAITLSPEEVARRAEEAAFVMVQLLYESGLVIPHGDLTAPEAYSLPDGVIRRVLRAQMSNPGSPAASGPA
jgi:hypothetical protein